ncbi:uncharacterized protein EI90DRAFT_56108 [Cantharellus anzutake]|uniref:uncharacterized protein n=1 Tax=Cantharellus anzutake TaxID=1750568 RepID=UPI001904347F|nr:uncharacterized protein EI90DRAFT_56108 [Cantharellus anzutake]KAF8344199.1 hypothetical protein EI90DRAFT_56108 [Cantharellus anzutake]
MLLNDKETPLATPITTVPTQKRPRFDPVHHPDEPSSPLFETTPRPSSSSSNASGYFPNALRLDASPALTDQALPKPLGEAIFRTPLGRSYYVIPSYITQHPPACFSHDFHDHGPSSSPSPCTLQPAQTNNTSLFSSCPYPPRRSSAFETDK